MGWVETSLEAVIAALPNGSPFRELLSLARHTGAAAEKRREAILRGLRRP
jgi:hypothetical protein